jgi:subtilisin family serine protease
MALASLGLAFLFIERGAVVSQELVSLSYTDFVADEVLAKFKEGNDKVGVQAAIESVQGNIITFKEDLVSASDWDPATCSNLSFIDVPYLVRLRVPESVGTRTAISILRQNPNIEYAEPNLKYHFFADDEVFPYQWALYNHEQTGGTDDADIDAPEAWAIFTGNPDLVVAVIDSGIDWYHEDLSNNIWHNPGEAGSQANDGIDNDANGYIDDFIGWNFEDGNKYPYDEIGHGTHVAGIIGAEHDNIGKVKGVCGEIKLMALKWSGSLNLNDAIPAIYYAANNGAKVINASWGDDDYSHSLYNAIYYARSKGVLFVAAAGNTSQLPHPNNDAYPVYPASYYIDNIVSVLSTDRDDSLSSFSHYGLTSVDLGAPGGTGLGGYTEIVSTWLNNTYYPLAGTSMAAPHVVGAAALAWGRCPELNYAQLKARMLEKTDKLPALDNTCVSEGRLNLYSLIYDSAAPDGDPILISGECYSWQSINLAWSDNSSNEIGFELQRQKTGEPDFTPVRSFNKNCACGTDTSAYGTITNYYRIRAYNMAGTSSFSNTLTYTIPATAPSAPSNLTAPEWCAEYSVELSWNDNANNEQAFAIERSRDESGIWEEVGTAWTDPQVANPTITWTDTMVSTGTYNYRVKAKNPAGTSDYSNVIYVVVGIY